MKNSSKENKAELIVRVAKLDDIPEIQALSDRVYTTQSGYTAAELRGQIKRFPKGQFVAVYKGKIVGYCASMITTEEKAMTRHSWRSITGGGYCSTHNPKGDFLYGVEVFVDPDYRRMKIGERLYKERKKLCKNLQLKGIVFAGRMPLMRKKYQQVGSPEAYLEQVLSSKIRDPVIRFQIRQGFEIIGILKDYMRSDYESMGNAIHMVWYNSDRQFLDESTQKDNEPIQKTVRVAAVQYQQRAIQSFEEFEQMISYFVDVVHDYNCDFVLFPELFTMQLLSIEKKKMSPEKGILKLSSYTERLKEFFKSLAIKYNTNIIAGSHPVKVGENSIRNVCFVCLRDGSIYEQSKIHPTPDEQYWWNITGGDELVPIETDCGTIGVLICYDSEFPELARYLVDQGADILFVPFCTDQRQSYLRVRYCSHARAVENQCYVALAGNVGNLPMVGNMDIQYGQSCILTPCDFAFSRDGIAADSSPNVETVIFADLNLNSLYESRMSGSVVNLNDRRHDLFSIVWHHRP